MRWQRIVIGWGKSRHCQTWIESHLLWNIKSRRKQNLTAKCTNLAPITGNSNSDFVVKAALWGEKDLNVSLNIACVEKAAGKTCGGRRHGHVGSHLVGALDKWSFADGGTFCALRLIILHCIWDGVGDTFQLCYRWPWAVVCEALLAAVPWNEHDVAVWNIRVGKQSNRRGPEGVVCVNLRVLCSNRYNFHHGIQGIQDILSLRLTCCRKSHFLIFHYKFRQR